MLDLNINTIQFLILTQLIIFILGWPLEWSEINIILSQFFYHCSDTSMWTAFLWHFNAINLQTSFLTPPMAMSAYYLKGVAPPGVKLVTIFKGCLPFLSMVFCHCFGYIQPKIVTALPDYFYSVNTEEVTVDVEDPNVIDPSFSRSNKTICSLSLVVMT